MADQQKDLAECRRAYKHLHISYTELSEFYGKLLLLRYEEPCTHPAEANCWHKSRLDILNNFPKPKKIERAKV